MPESEEAEPAEFLRVGWKALADKSKMEILRLLKTKPMYNQELAETLGLTAATFDGEVSPVTLSVKVMVPSTFSSRSSNWVSRRNSAPPSTGPAATSTSR